MFKQTLCVITVLFNERLRKFKDIVKDDTE